MSDPVRPHRQQPIGLLCPWDSPGKNAGVGCHFLLQSEVQDRIQSSLVAKYNLWHTFPFFYFPSCFNSSIFFPQHTLLHVFLYFLLIAFLLLGLHFLSVDTSVLFLLSSWNGSFACKQNERKFVRWMIWIAVNTEGCFFPGNSAGKESSCNSEDLSMLPVGGSSPGEKG